MKIAHTFIVLIAVVIILIYGKSLLIPFVLALLIWFIIKEIRGVMQKWKFIKKRVPFWLQSVLASFIILLVLASVVSILDSQIIRLSTSLPVYETNIDKVITTINTRFQIDLLNELSRYSGEINFSQLLSGIFGSVSDLFGNAFLIIIYLLFILLEESVFSHKINAIYSEHGQLSEFKKIQSKIDTSIGRYLGMKTFVGFITAVASYIILYILGIDAPVFWAFLIFLLNYIPTVGSLIATLFPAFFALVQFGNFTEFTLILVLVGAIQLIVGNILEPRIMGNSLNVSSLVVIIALSFWGALWGITGMVLSVPITVIMVIIFAQFSTTQSVARLMSQKGEIEI